MLSRHGSAIVLVASVLILAFAAPRAGDPGAAAGAGAAVASLPPAPPPNVPQHPLGRGARDVRARKPRAVVPAVRAVRAAAAYARDRGTASFAVVDSRGKLRGRGMDRLYPAASSVKAMVLAAELRRLADTGAPLDPQTDSLLNAMIRYSDNDAADAVYGRVGDAGLKAVAERAGMSGFTVAGHWGNAQVTAADLARFFADLDRMFPARHREYGRSLLAAVVPTQSWGIPVAAGERWAARFKGGWLPEKALVHQAAELRERGGPREIAIATLTDAQPSFGYGVETVEGVAERLLRSQTP